MRRLIFLLLTLFSFSASAQLLQGPVGYGKQETRFRALDFLGLPVRDTICNLIENGTNGTCEGAVVYRQEDKSVYVKTDTGWAKVGSGATDLSAHWDSTEVKEHFPIDTVQTVELMEFYTGKAILMVVSDPQRGGLFKRNFSESFGNEITRYPNIFGDVWDRIFDPANGIHLDWAPIDITGSTDASAALKTVFALPYNKFVGGPRSRYRLDDSIQVENKDSLIIDFNGATIYENVVHDRTFKFYGCNAITIKNANFDGSQTYSTWQAGTPTAFRAYVGIDSCDNAVVTAIRSKNKQTALAFRKAYKFSVSNVDHIGILDATHKLNANFCPALYIAHDGFDVVTRWNGYNRITNLHTRDGGSAILLGDDGQYYSISSIQGENMYDNGIYISSGLYGAITNSIFRNCGSTGIKVRGRAWVITGNVVTNSQVGIVYTGNTGDPFFGPQFNELGGVGFGTIVTGNTIDSVTAKGISVEAIEPSYTVNDVNVSNNIITHHTGTSSNYALQVSTIAGAVVTGNTIYSATGTSAAYVNNKAGDSTQYVNFSKNTIHAASGIGVTFDGMKNSTVEGNKFFDITGVCMSFLNCRGNTVINNTSPNGTIFSASGSNNNFDNIFEFNKGAALTTSVATNVVLFNWPNLQQGITGKPRLASQVTISSGGIYVATDTVSTANWTRVAPFTGGTGYIQNQTASAQAASFWIGGTGSFFKTESNTYSPVIEIQNTGNTRKAGLQLNNNSSSPSLAFWINGRGAGPGGNTMMDVMRLHPYGLVVNDSLPVGAITAYDPGSTGLVPGVAAIGKTSPGRVRALRDARAALPSSANIELGSYQFGTLSSTVVGTTPGITADIVAVSSNDWSVNTGTTDLIFKTISNDGNPISERMRIDSSGNVNAKKDVISRHYLGQPGTPTFTPSGSATAILGTGYTLNISGNDAHMYITITTGTGMSTSGTIGSITFNTAYGSTPVTVWSAANINALAAGKIGFNATTASEITVFSSAVLAPSTDYNFNIITGQ